MTPGASPEDDRAEVAKSLKELGKKNTGGRNVGHRRPASNVSGQPAAGGSRSFRKRMANWRRAQRRLKGADVRRADLGVVERTVDMGRSSARKCRQGYATTLLSSVKSRASSASRIILSYRHRGRGSTRSLGRTPSVASRSPAMPAECLQSAPSPRSTMGPPLDHASR